ncbi:MAG: hypothetical protein ACUVQ8_02195 [Nitrososphaeria archaeon]
MIGTESIREIMLRAYRKKILIPAFNVAYLPMVKPVAETLIQHKTFGLIEVAKLEVDRFGATSFEAVAEEYRIH